MLDKNHNEIGDNYDLSKGEIRHVHLVNPYTDETVEDYDYFYEYTEQDYEYMRMAEEARIREENINTIPELSDKIDDLILMVAEIVAGE